MAGSGTAVQGDHEMGGASNDYDGTTPTPDQDDAIPDSDTAQDHDLAGLFHGTDLEELSAAASTMIMIMHRTIASIKTTPKTQQHPKSHSTLATIFS